MKRYCMVNVITEEFVREYTEAHLDPWPELLAAIKAAGTQEELIYLYNNLAILFIECEDIEIYMEKFGNSDVGKKWLKNMSVLLAESEFADESGATKTVTSGLEKVFDLNQQLNGEWTAF